MTMRELRERQHAKTAAILDLIDRTLAEYTQHKESTHNV